MNSKIKVLTFLLVSAYLNISHAESRPSWTQSNTQSVSGKIFHVVCDGIGPSLDLARRDVLEKCRMTAANQLATNIHAKTVAVENEKEVAFHREISEENDYTGLTCKPGREYIEDLDGQSRVWLECTFNLAEATVKDADVSKSEIRIKKTDSWVSNKSDLAGGNRRSRSPGQGRYLTSDKKIMVLAVVPQCNDLLIRGDKPARIVKCTTDPITLTIEPADKEIIVRADNYIPKTIQLSEERGEDENVQIFLDPKN